MLISLIVPFFNLKAYVETTLASIVAALDALGEDRKLIEIICVDDGSTDGTELQLDGLADKTGFRIVHKANGGEGSARNTGIATATGDYLMFLDGDDVLLSNALVTAVRLVRRCPAADIIGMRYAVFADGSTLPAATVESEVQSFDTRDAVSGRLIRTLGVFPTLFRRIVFAGLRFSDLPLGADREYVMAALALANSVVMSDAVVEGYRVREGSMARARWTVGKVRSLNDHAVRGLNSLASSGKLIESPGAGYVASLVVSEVPARLARLGRVDGAHGLWRHWMDSVSKLPTAMLPLRIRIVRSIILSVRNNSSLSIGVARAFRAMNVV